MAGLVFMEGFETFGANGDTGAGLQTIIEQKWNQVTLNTAAKLSANAYEGEGLCLDGVSGSSSYFLTYSLDSTSKEFTVGFAVYSGTLSSGTWWAAGGTQQSCSIYVYNTGVVRIYCGASVDTPAGTIVANTWYYIEMQYKIDEPNGYWRLFIDGVLVESRIQDTWNAAVIAETGYNTWYMRNTGMRYDDIYIYDNTGDLQEPYGPVKIRALLPDGDDTTDWTSTGANHYDQVNDIPVETANYVENDIANDVDLFTFANSVDPDNWPIFGVQLNVYAAVTDVGVFTLEGIADSNGTQDTANETLVDNVGGQYTFVFEDDPETSNAWTMDKLNTAKFGVGVE